VVGHEAEIVKKALENYDVETVVQEPQLGTAHALMTARKQLEEEGEGDLLNSLRRCSARSH